jgi:hypothetical protein
MSSSFVVSGEKNMKSRTVKEMSVPLDSSLARFAARLGTDDVVITQERAHLPVRVGFESRSPAEPGPVASFSAINYDPHPLGVTHFKWPFRQGAS